MRWSVELIGEPADLDLLSQCQLNGAKIVSNGHGTWTCDVVSAGDVSVDDLLVEVGRRLALAYGSIRLMRGHSPIVRVGSVTRTDPEGRVATIIRPVGFATVNFSAIDPTIVVVDDCGQIVSSSPPPNPYEDPMALGFADKQVEKALRLLSTCPVGHYTDLYRIFEVVKGDLGDEDAIIAAELTSRNQLKRFTGSSQSVAVAGDLARHGHTFYAPPGNPMSPRQADEFLRGLVRKWIHLKQLRR